MCSYLFVFYFPCILLSFLNKTWNYDLNIHALDIRSCTPDSDFNISIYNIIFLYIILD